MSEEEKNMAENKIEMPAAGSLVLSSSPHIQEGETLRGIMLKVLLCLIPVVLSSIWFFGLNAVRVILLCTAFCVLFEYACCKIARTHNTTGDLSAAVTGVILALNLPPSIPWYVCVVGAFVAIVIAKAVFGGLGQNPFNPAAVARVALLIGFAGPMTHFTAPQSIMHPMQELITQATPLSCAKAVAWGSNATETFAKLESANLSAFLGNISGSLGETSAMAILIGGIGLLAFRLIRWQVPVAMIGTTFLFTAIVHGIAPNLTPGPVFHILTGGMMIGAFFMATDMVTSPMTKWGGFIFGCLIAVIACTIRIWGHYPEGVSFAIVIANALVPVIDKICNKHPMGWVPRSPKRFSMRRKKEVRK